MNAATVDFGQLVHRLRTAPRYTRANLVVLGGEFPAVGLGAFLDAWRGAGAALPWRIWEYTSRLVMAKQGDPATDADAWPTSVDYVERGRLFGAGGDLDLRRDRDRVLWRFVGLAETTLLAGIVVRRGEQPLDDYTPAADGQPARFAADSLWTAHPDAEFHAYDKQALLWGAENRNPTGGDEAETPGGTWWENRVAAATLVYPTMKGHERVWMDYRALMQAGRVAFVWYLGLGAEKEEGHA